MEPLFGYEEVEQTLQRFYTKPGHIFLLGPPGSGKTQLIQNFLHGYLTHHYGSQANQMKKTDVFFMNSHQDRGIHTVRNVLLDYVRQPTCKPGTVRWIVIDHLESFPELSQQALRRPMELYSHVACFIFIGTNRSHIIAPLLSRCKIVQLPDVQLELISEKILKKYGAKEAGLPNESIIWLISHSNGIIREFCQYIALIVEYLKVTKPSAKEIHGIILEICSIPSFELYMPLITCILQGQRIEVLRRLTHLWMAGESFEDIFETVKKITDMFGYTGVDEGYKIYEFLMNGWIQYSQGYTTYRSLLTT
jgi:DNA polymerase III gamma/tau subunit